MKNILIYFTIFCFSCNSNSKKQATPKPIEFSFDLYINEVTPFFIAPFSKDTGINLVLVNKEHISDSTELIIVNHFKGFVGDCYRVHFIKYNITVEKEMRVYNIFNNKVIVLTYDEYLNLINRVSKVLNAIRLSQNEVLAKVNYFMYTNIGPTGRFACRNVDDYKLLYSCIREYSSELRIESSKRYLHGNK